MAFNQNSWAMAVATAVLAKAYSTSHESRDETLPDGGLTQLLFLPECILLLVLSTIDGSKGYTSYLRQPRSLF